MAQEETRQGTAADVDREEFAKERRARGEGGHDAAAQARRAIEDQEKRSHLLREGEKGGVVRLVEVERALAEGVGEERGLAEGESEALAGDGVDGAGGVSDEGDVIAGDAGQAAGEREAAALGGDGLVVEEAAAK